MWRDSKVIIDKVTLIKKPLEKTDANDMRPTRFGIAMPCLKLPTFFLNAFSLQNLESYLGFAKIS